MLIPALVSVLGAWIVLTALFASLNSKVYAGFWDTGAPQYFLVVKFPWAVGFAVGIVMLSQDTPDATGHRRPWFLLGSDGAWASPAALTCGDAFSQRRPCVPGDTAVDRGSPLLRARGGHGVGEGSGAAVVRL